MTPKFIAVFSVAFPAWGEKNAEGRPRFSPAGPVAIDAKGQLWLLAWDDANWPAELGPLSWMRAPWKDRWPTR